ncbi:MAG TPA: hypothetical protein VLH77_06140, partial [Gammaproteobacteria bacterium]|nr:hypothetical protein [Gammaproteobacteria bacterium]
MPMPDPKPLEAKLKNIPLANATLAQTLATQGYFESNRPFHPKDLDVVLSDYLELKGEIKVINGNQYTWHDPRDPTAKRELQNQIRLAFETKQRVLIPINNGSGHYVCIDIEKLPDGRKTAYLIDSMAEMKVSQQHKKSNQELIKLVTEALPPGAVVTPLYTRQQQDNATCPYYAVR